MALIASPWCAHTLPRCTPAGREVCDFSQRRVHLKDTSHSDNQAVIRTIGRPTRERPRVIVGVVDHPENRMAFAQYLSRRDRGDILCLIEGPRLAHDLAKGPKLVRVRSQKMGQGFESKKSSRN